MKKEKSPKRIIVFREMTEEEKLFDKLVAKNGREKQLRQLQEECAELIVAINHYLRAEQEYNFIGIGLASCNLIEEVADVEIMLAQLPCMFAEFRQAVNGTKQKKLEKLKERVQHGRNL